MGLVQPALPLTDAALDPCGERRSDVEWIRQQWLDPAARVAVLAGERVLIDRTAAGGQVVQWLSPSDLRTAQPDDSAAAPYPGDWVFLGLAADGIPHFAVAASGSQPLPDDTLVPVRQFGLAEPGSPDLRIVVGGLAILNWHRRHRRCPMCGTPTVIEQGGWVRRCPTDSSQHFPRVDPAVIMLVLDTDDRALLGRQARWPQLWFSTLAGFVEPGETLENAVAREVLEEVGIDVEPASITYRASQPWPFPSSLMLGFTATARSTQVRPADGEIAEARWFTRDGLAAQCQEGAVRLPPRFSISRWLIEQWFGSDLPGDWSRE